MSEVQPVRLLILCTDLIFSTKITGTAKSLGVPFAVVRTLEKLREQLAAHPIATFIVDLNADRVNAIEAVRVAKAHAPSPRVVAFLSHVQVELAQEAGNAGADEVLARSGFVAQLPAILTAAK